jgi:ABC-type multidrug transport system ATPase subunit
MSYIALRDSIERIPISLDWQSINVHTYPKRNSPSKTILHNCKGHVKSGEFLAILGPSGAGKTTLLNVISQRYIGNGIQCTSGQVKLNNIPIDDTPFKYLTGFVPQDDILMGTLTPREAITFAARLSLLLNPAEIEAKVSMLIQQLGLSGCADSKIGMMFQRGISGGEKKRTSIGVEVVTDPPILILDEPTTGLDSYTALQIINLVKAQAREFERIVIATIHQPNSEIYASFDKLLLLRKGETVYIGNSIEAVHHFKKKGFPMQDNYNPADHFLKVLSEMTEEIDTDEKISTLALTQSESVRPIDSPQTLILPAIPSRPSAWSNFNTLCKRTFIDSIRNPLIVTTKFAKLIISSFLTVAAFYDLGTDRIGCNDRFGNVYVILSTAFLETLVGTLTTFQMDKALFRREFSGRKYGVLPFYLAYNTVNFPYEILFSVLYVSICYYLLNMNNHVENFFKCILVCVLSGMSGSCFGIFASVIAPNIGIASAFASVSSI